MGDLLSSLEPAPAVERLSEAAVVLRRFAKDMAAELVAKVDAITATAPFRNMITPGGFRMSVGMTNCGRAGWVTDRKGYRYEPIDPITGTPWPTIPGSFRGLAASAAAAAGYPDFEPDACLINLYEPGTRLSLHRDENERDLTTDYGIPGQVDHPRLRAAYERVAEACRAHGKVLGVGGIRHNVALQGELIRLGARFVIAGTDVNYVLAGARQDTTALRAIPLG